MHLKTFLSYASERLKEVEPLTQFVRALGAECWFDKHSLTGGDDWDKERKTAQDECHLFLAAISKETQDRNGVIHRELNDAIEKSKDKRDGQLYIIPLKLDDEIEIPNSLRRYHWIDLRKEGWRTELAKTIRKSAQQNGADITPAMEVAAASRPSDMAEPHLIEEEDPSGSRRLEYFTFQYLGAYWSYVNAEIIRLG